MASFLAFQKAAVALAAVVVCLLTPSQGQQQSSRNGGLGDGRGPGALAGNQAPARFPQSQQQVPGGSGFRGQAPDPRAGLGPGFPRGNPSNLPPELLARRLAMARALAARNPGAWNAPPPPPAAGPASWNAVQTPLNQRGNGRPVQLPEGVPQAPHQQGVPTHQGSASNGGAANAGNRGTYNRQQPQQQQQQAGGNRAKRARPQRQLQQQHDSGSALFPQQSTTPNP